jgi:hypothetical protein
MGAEQGIALTGEQIDALYAANNPGASNPFATLADIVASSNNLKSEYLFPVGASYAKNGVQAMSDFVNIPFPVNPGVVDGRSRKIQIITTYDKLNNGNSTINFRVLCGGLVLGFIPFTTGVGIISGRFLIFELDMTFSAANTQRALCRLYNQNATAETNRQTILGNGVWDKTIANNIQFQWETITGAGINHQLSVHQVTSILI